jgi:hypothetical protein
VKNLLAGLCILALAGCGNNNREVKLHPWQYPGNQYGASVAVTPDWKELIPTQYQHVATDQLPMACQLLETASVIGLPKDQLHSFSPDLDISQIQHAQACLVRGVSLGDPDSDRIRILYNPNNGDMLVFHGTYTGEFYPALNSPKVISAPMVVLLPLSVTIKNVYPTAMSGGDAVWR